MKFVYGNDGNAPHGVPAMENGSLRLVFAVPAALEKQFLEDGGLKEKMSNMRREARKSRR